ncbi:hypothetical protein ACFWA9_10335 [Kitasatospora sp. NPDC059973]|uniref:hypothetical protein n=1 Tax=Kitasatospora sp. NPDC059973 TaxID=3347020 RepID=UPI00367FF78B
MITDGEEFALPDPAAASTADLCDVLRLCGALASEIPGGPDGQPVWWQTTAKQYARAGQLGHWLSAASLRLEVELARGLGLHPPAGGEPGGDGRS